MMPFDDENLLVFTGGGSGGHLFPSVSLIEYVNSHFFGDFKLLYIGSSNPIERQTIESLGVDFVSVSSGKLRRTLKSNHIRELWYFIKGICEAYIILRDKKRKKKKLALLSTGGYVSLGPVVAAWLLGYKVFIHEQTSRVGLSNTIGSFFSKKVFVSFNSSHFIQKSKVVFSGYPLRKNFFEETQKTFNGIDLNELTRPIVSILGGGNGSRLLNEVATKIRGTSGENLTLFHQTGRAFLKDFLPHSGALFYPFDFSSDLPNLLKGSDVVITRSGAGICHEILALRKKAVFIPLKMAYKNEQFFNAKEVITMLGFGEMIEETAVDETNFLEIIYELLLKDTGEITNNKEETPGRRLPQEIIISTIENFLSA